MKCPNCSERMNLRGHEHVTKVGGCTVTDGSGLALTCGACGEVVLTADQLAGYERRAARMILRDGKNVSGEVLKFARKSLGLRQKDLAHVLKCSEHQLSRWENGDDIDLTLRLAMATLLDGEPIERVGTHDESSFEIRKAS